MHSFIKEYLESKVMVVCRGIPEEEIVNVAQALYDGGIRFMEVPFNQAEPSSFAETARKIKLVKEAMVCQKDRYSVFRLQEPCSVMHQFFYSMKQLVL